MLKFLSLTYWFNIWGGTLIAPVRNVFIIFIILLLIIIIISTILKKKNTKTLYFKVSLQMQLFSFLNFIISLFLLLFTDQRIPLLSARFWFLIWGVEMIFWSFFIFKMYKKIPDIKKKIAKEKEFKKYIP